MSTGRVSIGGGTCFVDQPYKFLQGRGYSTPVFFWEQDTIAIIVSALRCHENNITANQEP